MRTRAFDKVLLVGLCAALVLGGAVVVSAVPASATAVSATPTACDPDNLNARADIDGDGKADVAVGGFLDATGVVDVRGTGSPSVVLDAASLGVHSDTGVSDDFGAAIAITDLDQDGCADLVIGAPAEGEAESSNGSVMPGQVHIVFGRVGGVDTSTSIMLMHESSDRDKFGSTLALTVRYDSALGQTVHDLYVGAPNAEVNGQAEAGEVFRFTLAPNPGGRVVATLREVRSQDSPGVPGSSEKGDGFGSVLAATQLGGVLVGAPYEDIGSMRDAGAVWFLRVNSAGLPITSQRWSQNSAGMPGVAETKDHFGAALASQGSMSVVGIPGEGYQGHPDAGMIQMFGVRPRSGRLTIGRAITQDSPGIPGKVEDFDQFGAAVAVGIDLMSEAELDVAVGAPGESIGTRASAGAITLIELAGRNEANWYRARTLRQGSGLAGAAETGDLVGAVLSVIPGELDQDPVDYSDRLLIGVPDEGIGAVESAGMVQPGRGGLMVDGVNHTTLKFSKGYLLTNFYGLVLASVSG